MRKVWIDSFAISGWGVRTNNAKEASGTGQIPVLWAQFNASQSSQPKVVYGVYSDYESDFSGDYTVTVGAKACVMGNSMVPIKSGWYLAFPVKGEMPNAIIDVWGAIWNYFSEDIPYERAYETDFEQYETMTSATVYIGFKQKAAGQNQD